ncbi:unnamed protein product [Linum trigynum]|uniref:Uncharacterized protein n=1 Tax=Linum trigynum TaxID=586398 RepID=A0AAV2CXC0_9ROSI
MRTVAAADSKEEVGFEGGGRSRRFVGKQLVCRRRCMLEPWRSSRADARVALSAGSWFRECGFAGAVKSRKSEGDFVRLS